MRKTRLASGQQTVDLGRTAPGLMDMIGFPAEVSAPALAPGENQSNYTMGGGALLTQGVLAANPTAPGNRSVTAATTETLVLVRADVDPAVESRSTHRVARSMPVTGERLFHVESGIITDWWRNCGEEHILEIFPYTPGLVGQPEPGLVLGKLSGTASILMALERQGIAASEGQVSDIMLRVKQKAIEKKSELSQAEFDTIIQKVLER